MSWVTVIWSMAAAAALTLAGVHLLVWARDRTARVNLLFAVTATLVAAFALMVLRLMHAETPAEYGVWHRWAHVPIGLASIALVGFVWLHFGTGRVWLLWLVIGLRVLVLVLDFLSPVSFNFREITALQPFSLLDETVMVPVGVATPWARLGEGSVLLALGFVVDAAVSLWRRGNARERRRALIVGGSVALAIALSFANSILIHTGWLPIPYFISLFFVLIVLAMAYELGQDVIHASEMARDLDESQQRMDLAVTAANLGLWTWDLVRDEIWATAKTRELFGVAPDERLDFQRFIATLHPEDREPVSHAVARAMNGDGDYEAEYRVVAPGSCLRWLAALGHMEFDAHRKPVRLRGVVLDITGRKRTEQELRESQIRLAHAERVTTVGHLATALAHELSQPLGAILRNSEAAELMLQQPAPDLEELRAIITDILSDNRRAGDVIDRLRSLLKRRALEARPVDLPGVMAEVVSLVRADAAARQVTIHVAPAAALPPVLADRVHLQQVLINLLLNALDATSAAPPERRRIEVSARAAEPGFVEVSVSDGGPGIPPENLPRLFESFFTTKPQGMGMGLPISKTIMEAHRGRIWAENLPDGGACFRFTLPVAGGQGPVASDK